MTIEIALVLLILLAALVLFVTKWLRTDITKTSGTQDLQGLYSLRERIVALRVPEDSLLVGRSIAASASLASPVAHPANVLVMGPGGYRFVDYLKLGLPLTLVVFVVTMLLLPWVWPLQ